MLCDRLQGHEGVEAARLADETGNPFERVILRIDAAAAGFSATDLARRLAGGTPRIMVRSLYADRGILQIDVRRMDEKILDLVARRVIEAMGMRADPIASAPAPADRGAEAVLNWLADA